MEYQESLLAKPVACAYLDFHITEVRRQRTPPPSTEGEIDTDNDVARNHSSGNMQIDAPEKQAAMTAQQTAETRTQGTNEAEVDTLSTADEGDTSSNVPISHTGCDMITTCAITPQDRASDAITSTSANNTTYSNFNTTQLNTVSILAQMS
ncbi:hypothetical protein RI367_008538 [Sorochytrium milnesiophthora]